MPPEDETAIGERHRVAILVLGMHRSGTSALTWLLGRMGAALPRDPIGATEQNSKGYFESEALVKADDLLIRALRSSWFDPRPLDLSRVPPALLAEREAGIVAAIGTGFGAASLFAVKDPRQCRFVPTIARLLAGVGARSRAVIVHRSAADVAASLHARDRTTPTYAHLLWLRHMLDAERDTRAMPRAVIRYDDLLADWRGSAARIAPLLGADGWAPDTSDAKTIDAFFEPALRHHVATRATLDQPLRGLIDAAERGFEALVRDELEARAMLDAVAAELAAMPWIEGDIVHDELRHRRAPAPDRPAREVEDAEPVPPPEPALDTADDATDDADRKDEADLIRHSGLFDPDWYRERYPDAAASGLDPVDHYLRVGAARGYNPNPLFETGYYVRQMARRMGGARR